MAVTVRPERSDDVDAIDEVVAAAFLGGSGSTIEVALVRNLRERGELIGDLTLVAEVDGQVVGHVAFSEVTLDGRPARGLGLGPVAVAPDHQGCPALPCVSAAPRASPPRIRRTVGDAVTPSA
jgi:putative acetyltransferase